MKPNTGRTPPGRMSPRKRATGAPRPKAPMTRPPSAGEVEAALVAWRRQCDERAAKAANAVSAFHLERSVDAALAAIDGRAGVLTLMLNMSASQLEALSSTLREAQEDAPFWVQQTRREREAADEALLAPMPEDFLADYTRWARRERNREVMAELKRRWAAAAAGISRGKKPTLRRPKSE